MSKKTTLKLLRRESIDINELTSYIADYLTKLNREFTVKQLNAIIQLIQTGYFKLDDSINYFISKYNLNVVRIYDKQGQLLKTIAN